MRSRKPPLFIRFVTATLLAAFTVSDAAWAAPDGISGAGTPNIPTVRLREELGRVETAHRGTGPFLIHIRDAHSNPGAQKNIAEILRLLRSEHGVKTVFLEGGTRDDSLGFLAERAPLETRRRVANAFVLSGELSGAELLSATTDPDLKLLGVEDAALYDRNLRRYAEVKRSRETVLADLSRIRQRTASLKRRHFSKTALDFDEVFRAFRSREAAFSAVFLKFREAGRSSRINALAYPHLLGLARLQALEEQVDFSRAQKEMARRLSQTTDGLKPSLPALGKFKRGSPAELQFFESLIATAPAADVEALAAYVGYLRAFSQIDLEKVFGEMEFFEDEFFRQALDSPESRSLYRIGRHLDRLEDLFRMGISRADFERLQSDAKDIRFRTVSILAFLNRLLVDAGRFEDVLEYSPAIDRAREPAEAFYRENDLRDRAIVENAARSIRQSGEKAAVLIAGGYHTESLKRLLAERGFSYAVVSPNVEVETNHEQYEKVLFEGLDSGAGKSAGLSASSIPPKLILERAAAGARFAAAIQAGTQALPHAPVEGPRFLEKVIPFIRQAADAASGSRLAAAMRDRTIIDGLLRRFEGDLTAARRWFVGSFDGRSLVRQFLLLSDQKNRQLIHILVGPVSPKKMSMPTAGSFILAFGRFPDDRLAVRLGARVWPEYQRSGLASGFVDRLRETLPEDAVLYSGIANWETLLQLARRVPPDRRSSELKRILAERDGLRAPGFLDHPIFGFYPPESLLQWSPGRPLPADVVPILKSASALKLKNDFLAGWLRNQALLIRELAAVAEPGSDSVPFWPEEFLETTPAGKVLGSFGGFMTLRVDPAENNLMLFVSNRPLGEELNPASIVMEDSSNYPESKSGARLAAAEDVLVSSYDRLLQDRFLKGRPRSASDIRPELERALESAGLSIDALSSKYRHFRQAFEPTGPWTSAQAFYLNEILNRELFIPAGKVFIFNEVIQDGGSHAFAIAPARILEQGAVRGELPDGRVFEKPYLIIDGNGPAGDRRIESAIGGSAMNIPTRIYVLNSKMIEKEKIYLDRLAEIEDSAGVSSRGEILTSELLRRSGFDPFSAALLFRQWADTSRRRAQLRTLFLRANLVHEGTHALVEIMAGHPADLLLWLNSQESLGALASMIESDSSQRVSLLEDRARGLFNTGSGRLRELFRDASSARQKAQWLSIAEETLNYLTELLEVDLPINVLESRLSGAVRFDRVPDYHVMNSHPAAADWTLRRFREYDASKPAAASNRLYLAYLMDRASVAKKWADRLRAEEFDPRLFAKWSVTSEPLAAGRIVEGARLAVSAEEARVERRRRRVLAINLGDLAATKEGSEIRFRDPVPVAASLVRKLAGGPFGTVYFYGRGLYPISESSTLIHRVGQPELENDPRVHRRLIDGVTHYFLYVRDSEGGGLTMIHVSGYDTKRQRVNGRDWTDRGNNFSILGMDRRNPAAAELSAQAKKYGLDVWYDFIPWLAPEALGEPSVSEPNRPNYRWARQYRDWKEWPKLHAEFRGHMNEWRAAGSLWFEWLEDRLLENPGFCARVLGMAGSEHVVLLGHVGGMGGFNVDQVDLNVELPEVKQYWTDSAAGIRTDGAAGIRVDLAENLLRRKATPVRDIVGAFAGDVASARRVVTEGYGGNRPPLADQGSDGVYFPNLFETYLYYATTEGVPASIFRAAVLDAIREGSGALIYPSNFDQTRLAALGRSVEAYLLLTAATAHLAGATLMVDFADLLKMTGHIDPIAGGNSPPQGGHAHLFDALMKWLGNPAGLFAALGQAPLTKSIDALLEKMGPSSVDRSRVRIFDTENDSRYLALAWPDAENAWNLLVFDFAPESEGRTVKIFIPEDLRSEVGLAEPVVEFGGESPFVLQSFDTQRQIDAGARLAAERKSLEAAKIKLRFLVTRAAGFSWGAAADLPSLEGAVFPLDALGRFSFSIDRTFQYAWPILGRAEPGWTATVVRSFVHRGRYTLELRLSNGEKSMLKSFQVGPFEKTLFDKAARGESMRVLAIEERPGLQAIAQVVDRSTADWGEDGGYAPSFHGLALGKPTAAHGNYTLYIRRQGLLYPYTLGFGAFRDWNGYVDGSFKEGVFELTFHFEKEGNVSVPIRVHAGPSVRRLKSVGGRKKLQRGTAAFLDIDYKTGAKALAHLLGYVNNGIWALHEAEILDLVGHSLGPVDRYGMVSLYLDQFHFRWAVMGSYPKDPGSWSASIVAAGLVEGQPQIAVRLSDGAETFYRVFQIGPFKRIIPGEKKEAGKFRWIFDIWSHDALGSLLQVYSLPGEKAWTERGLSVAHTIEHPFQAALTNQFYDRMVSILESFTDEQREIAHEILEGNPDELLVKVYGAAAIEETRERLRTGLKDFKDISSGARLADLPEDGERKILYVNFAQMMRLGYRTTARMILTNQPLLEQAVAWMSSNLQMAFPKMQEITDPERRMQARRLYDRQAMAIRKLEESVYRDRTDSESLALTGLLGMLQNLFLRWVLVMQENPEPVREKTAHPQGPPSPADIHRIYENVDSRGLARLGGKDFFLSAVSKNPAIRKKIAEIADSFGGELHILSVGLGRGELEADLRNHGHRVTGIDLNYKNLQSSIGRQIDSVQADGHALPFGPGTFDLVLFSESIGNMDLDRAIGNAGFVLKPGGHVLVAAVGDLSPGHAMRHYNETRFIHYPADVIRAALERGGLRYDRTVVLRRELATVDHLYQIFIAEKPVVSAGARLTAGLDGEERAKIDAMSAYRRAKAVRTAGKLSFFEKQVAEYAASVEHALNNGRRPVPYPDVMETLWYLDNHMIILNELPSWRRRYFEAERLLTETSHKARLLGGARLATPAPAPSFDAELDRHVSVLVDRNASVSDKLRAAQNAWTRLKRAPGALLHDKFGPLYLRMYRPGDRRTYELAARILAHDLSIAPGGVDLFLEMLTSPEQSDGLQRGLALVLARLIVDYPDRRGDLWKRMSSKVETPGLALYEAEDNLGLVFRLALERDSSFSADLDEAARNGAPRRLRAIAEDALHGARMAAPVAASSFERTFADLQREGYRLMPSEKTLPNGHLLLKPILLKNGFRVVTDIEIEVSPEEKVIFIGRFYPQFDKPVKDREKVGRGRALLREILNPDRFAGYEVLSDANPAFLKSLARMSDWSPVVGTESPEKLKEIQVSGWKKLSGTDPVVSGWFLLTTFHGKIPPARVTSSNISGARAASPSQGDVAVTRRMAQRRLDEMEMFFLDGGRIPVDFEYNHDPHEHVGVFEDAPVIHFHAAGNNALEVAIDRNMQISEIWIEGSLFLGTDHAISVPAVPLRDLQTSESFAAGLAESVREAIRQGERRDPVFRTVLQSWARRGELPAVDFLAPDNSIYLLDAAGKPVRIPMMKPGARLGDLTAQSLQQMLAQPYRVREYAAKTSVPKVLETLEGGIAARYSIQTRVSAGDGTSRPFEANDVNPSQLEVRFTIPRAEREEDGAMASAIRRLGPVMHRFRKNFDGYYLARFTDRFNGEFGFTAISFGDRAGARLASLDTVRFSAFSEAPANLETLEQILDEEMEKAGLRQRVSATTLGIYKPTPLAELWARLQELGIGPGKRVVDLGSGDGRLIFLAALMGAQATGFEHDPVLIGVSRSVYERLSAIAPLGAVEFVQGDFFDPAVRGDRIRSADLVYYYWTGAMATPKTMKGHLTANEDVLRLLRNETKVSGRVLLYDYDSSRHGMPFAGWDILPLDGRVSRNDRAYERPADAGMESGSLFSGFLKWKRHIAAEKPINGSRLAANDVRAVANNLSAAVDRWAGSIRLEAGERNWSRRIVLLLDKEGLPSEIQTGESADWQNYPLGGYQLRISLHTGKVRFVQYHAGRESVSLDQLALLIEARNIYNAAATGWLPSKGARLAAEPVAESPVFRVWSRSLGAMTNVRYVRGDSLTPEARSAYIDGLRRWTREGLVYDWMLVKVMGWLSYASPELAEIRFAVDHEGRVLGYAHVIVHMTRDAYFLSQSEPPLWAASVGGGVIETDPAIRGPEAAYRGVGEALLIASLNEYPRSSKSSLVAFVKIRSLRFAVLLEKALGLSARSILDKDEIGLTREDIAKLNAYQQARVEKWSSEPLAVSRLAPDPRKAKSRLSSQINRGPIVPPLLAKNSPKPVQSTLVRKSGAVTIGYQKPLSRTAGESLLISAADSSADPIRVTVLNGQGPLDFGAKLRIQNSRSKTEIPVSTGDYILIGPGTYDAVLNVHSIKPDKSSGKPRINFHYKAYPGVSIDLVHESGARLADKAAGLAEAVRSVARARRTSIARAPMFVPLAAGTHAAPVFWMGFTPGIGGGIDVDTRILSAARLKGGPDSFDRAPLIQSLKIPRDEIMGRGKPADVAGAAVASVPAKTAFPGQMLARLADIQADDHAVLLVDMNELLKANGRLKSPSELHNIMQILNLSLVYRGRTSDSLKLVLYGAVDAKNERTIRNTLKGFPTIHFVNVEGLNLSDGLPVAIERNLGDQNIRITKTLGLIYSPFWAESLGAAREMIYVETKPTEETSAYSILVALAAGKDGKVENMPADLRAKIASVASRAGRLVIELVPTPIVDFSLFLADLSRRTVQTSA